MTTIRQRTSRVRSTSATAPSATVSAPADQAGAAGLRVFTLTLVAKASPSNPGADPIRSLRWLLKIALRRFHLRCVEMRELV
jgi:hypothetical protein